MESTANLAILVFSDQPNQSRRFVADLAAKIKEIKSLSGDFKNTVDKEKDNTRKVVAHFEEALASLDSAGATGARL